MQSSVPAFKEALLARLKADPDITGRDLMVTWGDPFPLRASGELVVIANVTDRKLAPTAGYTKFNETYSVMVYVSVSGAPQNDMDKRTERAYALADAVTENIRAWNMAGPLAEGDFGQVNICTLTDSHDEDALVVDAKGKSGREQSVMLTFSVTARV